MRSHWRNMSRTVQGSLKWILFVRDCDYKRHEANWSLSKADDVITVRGDIEPQSSAHKYQI